jgi:hypothetical protein
MAIGSEVSGSGAEEIDVSVEVENSEVGLYFELIYLSFFWEDKAAQDWVRRWVMVPVIRGRLRRFTGDWRNKKPLWRQGLCAVECLNHFDLKSKSPSNR